MCVYVPCGRAKVKRSPAHLASLCGAGEKPPQYRVGIALTRRPGQGVGYMINCGTERERELSGGDGGLCVPGEPNRLTRLKRECGFVLMSSASTRGVWRGFARWPNYNENGPFLFHGSIFSPSAAWIY